MKQKPPPSSAPVLKALGTLGGLGFTFAIPAALGGFLGSYLQGYFQTGPWIILICHLGIRRQNLIPSGMQTAFEVLVEGLLGLVVGVSGKEKGRRFFPFVASFFIFILVANLLDVLPGVDTIGQIKDASHVGPLF